MERDARIYIAGHQGLVGSAIYRRLRDHGYTNLITCTHAELDLERQAEVESFFEEQRPEYVFLGAAKVGGIWANSRYPAEFIYQNLAIQTNVIHASWKTDVKRLLFLGSSCIYPRECPQPMREEYLLTGPLEPTNQPYAVAKIAGIIQCEAYNRQYGTHFLAIMPTNLYGTNDNFGLETSHVLPALIRKFHLAKLAAQGEWGMIERDETIFGPIPGDIMANLEAISRAHKKDTPASLIPKNLSCDSHIPNPAVILWGTGSPRREFLHVDDLADASLFLMNLPNNQFSSLLSPNFSLPLINIGYGEDSTVLELAKVVSRLIGYKGEIIWDETKPDGTPRKLLDVSRLRALGWIPRIDTETGIRLTYHWYLNQSSSGSDIGEISPFRSPSNHS